MVYSGKSVSDLKIAYIGGGSRGWAWGLMSDLAQAGDMSGEVYLYDIDYEAAKHNEIIGNRVADMENCKSAWRYKAAETLGEALRGADFVVISILPATFEEMHSDVHTPEKYGIYQSVGDTSGPGGIVRALRTIPMYEEFALAIKEYCPQAWVISYTNPMTVCIKTLYSVFPQIKAFGCCHEVFGTQKLLVSAVRDMLEIEEPKRSEIKVNVLGVNHFTWLTGAKYRNTDLFPLYKEFADKYYYQGYLSGKDDNWMNNSFACAHRVKFDLFKRFGYIAAAGDRHLAEFCPGDWYLKNPETVREWMFGLTSVEWRKNDLRERLVRSTRLINGEESFDLNPTGEDGVKQIKAILGLGDIVTNVNMPNIGQIPNLPLGAVVETNAYFTSDTVVPVSAGNVPLSIYPLISRICGEQQLIVKAALEKDLDIAFQAFTCDPLVRLSLNDAKKLFNEMLENTKEYLGGYGIPLM